MSPEQSSHQPRQRRSLLPLALLLIGGGAALAFWFSSSGPSAAGPGAAGPLDGKLMVFVRPPERAAEARPVEDPGAAPVQAGGIMSLQVQLNQPAYAYLIWLDTEGKAVPLYPWNTKEMEIKDFDQPPPLRQAAKLVYSPLFGGGWTFGSRGGMETVLLLARRTPLPEGTKLGALLAPLPPPEKVADPKAVAMFGLDSGAPALPPETEETLRALLMRLKDHFELIRAVRFAHAGE